MNRVKRGTKEYNRLQETLHENKRLKKTISKLRKQISRLDLDRYHNLKEIIEKHDRENQGESLAKAEAKIRKIWECWKCREYQVKNAERLKAYKRNYYQAKARKED